MAGGIPVIKTLREALAGNQIRRVYGILNGTCNYILTQMQEEHRCVRRRAEGSAGQGLCRSRPHLRHRRLRHGPQAGPAHQPCVRHQAWRFDQIHVEGIQGITQADIEAADDLGYRIKLLGVALLTESGIEQRVHPAMVPKHSAIAEVSGVTNCVAIDGDFVGNVLLAGPGAGAKATASRRR